MSTEEQQEDFYLELGDIIKINAPDNSDLDNKTFYIDYLDENTIEYLHEYTAGQIEDKLLDNGFFVPYAHI